MSRQELVPQEEVVPYATRTPANHAHGPSYKTGLAQAIMSDDLNTLHTLLLTGADINEFSYFRGHGESPLLTAIRYARKQMVEPLLKHGADVHLRSSRSQTPLLRSARRNYFPMMCILLHYQSDPNATDTSGRGALFWAVKLRNLAAVKELLKYGARVNMSSSHELRTTLLHTAVLFDFRSVTEAILEAGANVNARDELGETPLFSGVRKDNPQVVTLLLDHGASVNVYNQDSRSPLHISAASVHSDCIQTTELLLLNGAHVNALDRYQNSPLVLTLRNYVLRPIYSIARCLIQHGSDLRDPNLITALEWIVEANTNYDVLQYAVEAGFRLNGLKWVRDLIETDPAQRWGFSLDDDAQKQFIDYLKQTTRTCLSLSFFCRRTIREVVIDSGRCGSVCTAIRQLPLPEPIQSYLMLHGV